MKFATLTAVLLTTAAPAFAFDDGTLTIWTGANRDADALAAAAKDELHVIRGLNRTINLLEKPGEFLQDKKIKRTIFRYMLRGRKRNAAARRQPGLNRDEAFALIAATGE